MAWVLEISTDFEYCHNEKFFELILFNLKRKKSKSSSRNRLLNSFRRVFPEVFLRILMHLRPFLKEWLMISRINFFFLILFVYLIRFQSISRNWFWAFNWRRSSQISHSYKKKLLQKFHWRRWYRYRLSFVSFGEKWDRHWTYVRNQLFFVYNMNEFNRIKSWTTRLRNIRWFIYVQISCTKMSKLRSRISLRNNQITILICPHQRRFNNY